MCYNSTVGEVSEWLMVAVLKTAVPKGTVGSNPTLSAILSYHIVFSGTV